MKWEPLETVDAVVAAAKAGREVEYTHSRRDDYQSSGGGWITSITAARHRSVARQLADGGRYRAPAEPVSNAMTIPTEVAAVLAEMRELKVPNWPAVRILGDLADRIESALTKAEAVATVLHSDPYDETGSKGPWFSIQDWARLRELSPNTKLYAHAPPAVPVESLGRDADDIPTIDLDAMAWGQIKDAAKESPWLPPEYFMNDWVSDICTFLRAGPASFMPDAEPVASVPDGWLPIASAPKSVADGQRIGGIYLLGYVPDADVADPAACIDIIWWEPLLPNNRGGRGKWCASKFGDDCEVSPTHWQPLPPPPTNQQGAAP